MTAPDFGLAAFVVLAQNTQAPPPAAPASTAGPAPEATQAQQPAFNVPGATTGPAIISVPAPGGTGGGPAAPASSNPGGGLGLILPLGVVMVLMLVMTSMTGRKEKKKRESMISAVKKGDRVQTTAGVIGTIIDLGDQEMTLRVDESTNTRIRFTRAAIQSVLSESKQSGRLEPEVKPSGHAAATT